MTQTAAKTKTVTFLNRYAFKSTGSIVWHVRNGENKEYCVTLNANGSVGCYSKDTGKECPGHQYAYNIGHECHHILACQAKEAGRAALPELPEIDLSPNADGNYRNLLTCCMAMEAKQEPYVREETDCDAKTEQWLEGCIDDEESIDNLLLSETASCEVIDEAYKAWKREMGLDDAMTEEQVEQIIHYELAVL